MADLFVDVFAQLLQAAMPRAAVLCAWEIAQHGRKGLVHSAPGDEGGHSARLLRFSNRPIALTCSSQSLTTRRRVLSLLPAAGAGSGSGIHTVKSDSKRQPTDSGLRTAAWRLRNSVRRARLKTSAVGKTA